MHIVWHTVFFVHLVDKGMMVSRDNYSSFPKLEGS